MSDRTEGRTSIYNEQDTWRPENNPKEGSAIGMSLRSPFCSFVANLPVDARVEEACPRSYFLVFK